MCSFTFPKLRNHIGFYTSHRCRQQQPWHEGSKPMNSTKASYSRSRAAGSLAMVADMANQGLEPWLLLTPWNTEKPPRPMNQRNYQKPCIRNGYLAEIQVNGSFAPLGPAGVTGQGCVRLGVQHRIGFSASHRCRQQQPCHEDSKPLNDTKASYSRSRAAGSLAMAAVANQGL
jgi:hypothetical protein